MDDRPWTAARCNRLLRPLTTTLAFLNAEQTVKNNARSCQVSERKSEHELLNRDIPDASSSRIRFRDETAEEFDKAQIYRRKRVRRTYSGRGILTQSALAASDSQNPSVPVNGNPGEIIVSTPMLSRRWSRQTANALLPTVNSRDEAEILERDDPENFKHFGCRNKKMTRLEAVTTSFSAVMKQTQGADPIMAARTGQLDSFQEFHSNGARSLFSLCVQNIPAHILDEQMWRKEQDAEDKSDASADVYDFLESLGSGERRGWKPLREVLRAHAISLVQNAIDNKSIPPEGVQSLVMICIQYNALTGAKGLIRGWAFTNDAFKLPPAPSTAHLDLLNLLNSWSRKSKTSAFQYRLLIDLISGGTLPIEWTATSAFKNLWHKVINSVTQEDEDSGAAALFITEILLLVLKLPVNAPDEECDIQHRRLASSSPSNDDLHPFRIWNSTYESHLVAEFQNSLANTVSSLCTILCAITFIGKFSEGLESTWENLTRPIHHAASYLEDELVTTAEKVGRHILANRLLICGADALILSHAINESANTAAEALDRSVSRLISVSDTYDRDSGRQLTSIQILGQFFRSVARCYGRAQANTGFDLLSRMVHCMLNYIPMCDDGPDRARIGFMRRLALDTVMNFTETSSNADHVRLVCAAEQKVNGFRIGESKTHYAEHGEDSPVPRFDGLRWEEGICEWVVATPATMLKLRKSSQPSKLSHPGSPIHSIQASANNPTNALELQIPTSLGIHNASSKARTREPSPVSGANSDAEDEELVDSGVFLADDMFEPDSPSQSRNRSLKPLEHNLTIEDREIESNAEDELILTQSIMQHSSSCGPRCESGVANKRSLRRDVGKRRVQDGLDSWDLTSDELG